LLLALRMTLDRDRTWAIVLAGGEGTRLATLTTALYGHPLPKQFAAIDGGRSMLQATLARVEQIVDPERVVVIIGPAHVELAREQLRAFDGITLLVQPASLGTAVAILYGLAWIRAHDREAEVLMFPSDHYVADDRGFVEAAKRAAVAGKHLDRLVLVGTTPDSADPEYGWIVPGAPDDLGTAAVERFAEKPDPDTAERLLRDGGLWNTFVFAAPATLLARLARTHLPVHAARFDAWAFGGSSVADAFRDLASADFSRDVLQRASCLAVLAMPNVGWNDWGTPARVLASLRGKPAERQLRARIARRAGTDAVA
jgi:mannose-1-phosphate guanylyltransferase